MPERWGYRTDWRRPLLTRAIDPPAGLHQVEYYQHLVSALGFNRPVPFSWRYRISSSPRNCAPSASNELKGAGWDGTRPLVALAPGAAYGGAKRWPPASFAELARALASDGIQSVMVGGRADLPVAREIEAALERRRRPEPDGHGSADAGGHSERVPRARVERLGRDAPGAAIGIRVTAVFGPTDERLTRPAGDGHIRC